MSIFIRSRRDFTKAFVSGVDALEAGDRDGAIQSWRNAIEVARRDEEVVFAAHGAARSLIDVGADEEAEQFLITALDRGSNEGTFLVLLQQVTGRELRSEAFELLYDIAERRKDRSLAYERLQWRRRSALEHNDRQDAAEAAAELGNAAMKLGRPKEALTWYERALDEQALLGDRRSEALLWGAVGLCAKRLGDMPRALNALSWAESQCHHVGLPNRAEEYAVSLAEVRAAMHAPA